MKECPECGKKFNWLDRATGQDKEHIRFCCQSSKNKADKKLAATCRGCPAGCFEGTFENEEKYK
ncbi:hypothetical protein BMS3Bbin09_00169 [bacterium BMS3Bbin09]|nr:hypothetical protein BMS3Bbin09_00169 [bacterium BMS3Bbin09]